MGKVLSQGCDTQIEFDLECLCPMCRQWYARDELHPEDYLCVRCEVAWVQSYEYDEEYNG